MRLEKKQLPAVTELTLVLGYSCLLRYDYLIFVYFRKVAIPLFGRNKSFFEILLRNMVMKSLNCQLQLMALVMVYIEIDVTRNVPILTIPN